MRTSKINRKTNETNIIVELNLDGEGKVDISTGVPFFDHMLTQIGKHSLSDLTIKASGDLEIDCHHTVEDVGISLGLAIKEALGSMKGINRYGQAIIPMDEALLMCAIDISNRPFSVICDVEGLSIGNFDIEMVEEFFRALAFNAGINVHIDLLRGKNTHHIIEGMFKAFARALLMAVTLNPRCKDVPSSKGSL